MGVSLSISLSLEVVNASVNLGKWLEMFAGTELDIRVGRHFKDLLFKILSLQIILHSSFHSPYLVIVSHSSLVFVSRLPVKFSGLRVLSFAYPISS